MSYLFYFKFYHTMKSCLTNTVVEEKSSCLISENFYRFHKFLNVINAASKLYALAIYAVTKWVTVIQNFFVNTVTIRHYMKSFWLGTREVSIIIKIRWVSKPHYSIVLLLLLQLLVYLSLTELLAIPSLYHLMLCAPKCYCELSVCLCFSSFRKMK